MKKFLKWAVIIILAMIVIGNLFNGEAEEESEEVVEPAEFEIVEISEDHWMDSRRYNYRVVIEEEVDRERFESTARTIIDGAKEEKDYSGITMWFYAFEELSDGAYTLGRVMYAPEGDWGKAAETSPGDYDQMTYEIDFKQKDWSQRPSQEEVEIYKTWDYILYDYYDEHDDQEDVITDMTAEELGIGVEEVDRAVNNVSNWSMMGTFDDASENGIPDEFEEPAKEDKIEVELNVNHEISQDRTVQIVVETNLPDGIELSVGLSNDEIDYVAGDGVELSDGRAESAWFSDDGEALESGTYEVRVGTRYPHTQPDYVQEIIGEGGQNLTGEYVEEDDFGKTASKTKRIHINNN